MRDIPLPAGTAATTATGGIADTAKKLVSIHVHSLLQRRSTGALRSRSSLNYERNASRGPARPAELLWRAAHRLAGFFPIHHLADPARAATCNPGVRAGVSSRDCSEPERPLATEKPRTGLRPSNPGEACA